LIADDHPLVREGIKEVIKKASDIVVAGEAGSGAEVLEILKEKQIDLVLLDIAMPGRGGIEVLKDIKDTFSNMPVLILSMYPEDQYAVRSLKSGASGYLNKECATDQLVEAIRKIASGGKFVSLGLAEKLAGDLSKGINESPHKKLSDREFQVLKMIGAGKASSEIAEELGLSIKTVGTYRARILEKMGMKNNSQLMLYVLTNLQ
jgi:DNA-binding NarL/FixJ family response regulator